ncbi:MAG: hypothetical protein COA43_12745 [Robiginitomaculum sp.]|nr:MAG: hypothetical protein COA43_12745 [Robiginitomaculum sp.]
MREKTIPPFKKFMTAELVVTTIINFAFGAGFGWLAGKSLHAVPMHGVGGIVMDVIITCFAIGLLLTLISTAIVRKRIAKGEVDNIPESSLFFPMKSLPKKTLPRAMLLAVLGVVVLAPIIIGGFLALGISEISSPNFIWVKGAYGALIAILCTPYALMPMMAER